MKKALAHSNTNTLSQTKKLAAPRAFATLWRIIVPVVVGVCLGSIADGVFGLKPWLSLLGVVAGAMIAGALVKDLLGDVPDESN